MPENIQAAASEIFQQGLTLLEALGPKDYTTPHPAVEDGTIGGHYRHCLEHFEPLFQANSTTINYDLRKRDPEIEGNLDAAITRTRHFASLCKHITNLPLDQSITIQGQVTYGNNGLANAQSTLAREWMYAIAHAVHHYAIIGIMCNLSGIQLPESFGIAPSTIQYRQSLLQAENPAT